MAWKKSDDFEGTSLQAPRCYVTHPELKLGKGILCGGSAGWPVVKDADVYVSLQQGSTSGLASDPWQTKRIVVEVHYEIKDQQVPENVPRFKKLVTWLCNQLQDGKKVHVGCIGGHGRTGLVLAAIVAQLKEEKDAIQWVRAHYCKRAVESRAQIAFLREHYKVSKAECSKPLVSLADVGPKVRRVSTGMGGGPRGGFSSYTAPQEARLPYAQPSADRPPKLLVPAGVTPESKSFAPLASERCLWRRLK